MYRYGLGTHTKKLGSSVVPDISLTRFRNADIIFVDLQYVIYFLEKHSDTNEAIGVA